VKWKSDKRQSTANVTTAKAVAGSISGTPATLKKSRGAFLKARDG